MRLVPLGNKIVVQRDEAESKTPGGIIVPDVAKKKTLRGKVLAVGDGKLLADGTRQKMQVKEGDHVTFSAYAGQDITFNGQDLLFLTEDEILALVN